HRLRVGLGEAKNEVLPVAKPGTFGAKQTAIPDTNLLSITKLDVKAVPGTYRLRIDQVDQSHSASSSVFDYLSAPLGQGTLNLRLGSWAEDGTFSADANRAGATIEIDSSNTTLAGVRDAINASGLGVQASIVGSEGDYQLLLTSPTGARNELEITVDETAGAE